jgi:carboxymethylenebutenolidase
MCDEMSEGDLDRAGLSVGRRSFAQLAGVGGLAMFIPTVACAAGHVTGRDVSIVTSDGTADAYFVAPASGKYPGVLIWPDIRGLRPAFRQMADRLAGEGYSVLVVNPFYREAKAPVVTPADDFSEPDVRARLLGYAKALTPEAVRVDAAAHLAFLDAQSEVDGTHKLGVTGYCMGGPMTILTAATAPDRVGAVGSFHGGGVATDQADSPHLLIPDTAAAYLFAIADNDDARDPQAKTLLSQILKDRPQFHEVEVYEGAMHGWCPPDGRAYNEVQAERAWSRMLAMFKASL